MLPLQIARTAAALATSQASIEMPESMTRNEFGNMRQ